MIATFFPFGDGRRVLVMGRGDAEKYARQMDQDAIVVSYKDPIPTPWVRWDLSPHVKALIQVECLDQDALSHPDDVLFTDEHADKIVEMIYRQKQPIMMDIICQCEMGIARSSATAAAIAKSLGGDDMEIFQRKRPNMRIYTHLINAFHRRGEVS